MINWVDFQHKYRNELKYTQADLDRILEAQAKALRVNRVVQSFTGKYGPTESVAMQILAIHQTDEGTLVIVR